MNTSTISNGNGTGSTPAPVYPAGIFWPDIIVGFIFTLTCLVVVIIYIPCLVVMRREASMWKFSCIKVGVQFLLALISKKFFSS